VQVSIASIDNFFTHEGDGEMYEGLLVSFFDPVVYEPIQAEQKEPEGDDDSPSFEPFEDRYEDATDLMGLNESGLGDSDSDQRPPRRPEPMKEKSIDVVA
jgi:hypothetical protein